METVPGLDVSLQERVGGLLHPAEQAGTQILEQAGMGRVAGEIARLGGIEEQVEELLLGEVLLSPPVLDQDLLAGAVVAIGEHGALVVAEATDVLPALRPQRPQGLIGGVEGHLGVDLVVQSLGLAGDQRPQGLTLAVHPFKRGLLQSM